MDFATLTNALREETPWQKAYSALDTAVRDYFSANAEMTLSTQDLADAVLPERELRGPEQHFIRRRLFRGLLTMAKNTLADCATKSSDVTKSRFGTEYQRWNWHAPRTDRVVAVFKPKTEIHCPHCGGLIEIKP